jgi:hypothetical protein
MNSFNRKMVSQEERAIGGVEIYKEFSQKSSRWAKIQNSYVVRVGLSVSVWGFLGQSQTLFGWRFLFWMYEKDLTWLFSLHPHTSLNSTIFLYSRNIKTL